MVLLSRMVSQISACANDFLGLGIRSTSLSCVHFLQHVLDFFNNAKNVRGAHVAKQF